MITTATAQSCRNMPDCGGKTGAARRACQAARAQAEADCQARGAGGRVKGKGQKYRDCSEKAGRLRGGAKLMAPRPTRRIVDVSIGRPEQKAPPGDRDEMADPAGSIRHLGRSRCDQPSFSPSQDADLRRRTSEASSLWWDQLRFVRREWIGLRYIPAV